MEDVIFRSATAADAEQIAEIYLTSRKAFLGFAPLAHSDDEVRRWIGDLLIPAGGVSLAVSARLRGAAQGMMALSCDRGVGWLDHLYLLPSAVGKGLGRCFVERAKVALGSPIRLYTFQANAFARRFYERNGFRGIEFGDGSSNEENCPDVLYEWIQASDDLLAG